METWTKRYDPESKMWELWWADKEKGCIGDVYTEAYADAILRDHKLAALAEEVKRRVEAGLETPVRTVSDQRVVIAEMWDWLVDEYRARYDTIVTGSAEGQAAEEAT